MNNRTNRTCKFSFQPCFNFKLSKSFPQFFYNSYGKSYKTLNCTGFIETTREEVKVMKEKISAPTGGKSQRLSMLVTVTFFNIRSHMIIGGHC
jgi:hypothetical protein